MPILDRDSPVFSGLDLSDLPARAYELQTFNLTEFPVIRAGDLARWRALESSVVVDISQRIIGGELLQFGIPLGPSFEAATKIVTAQDAAKVIFSEFANMVGPEAEKLAQELMRKMIDETLEALGSTIDIVEWIPAYGWLIEAVWDVAMGIRNLVQLVKRQNAEPKVIYERGTYQPDYDVNQSSRLLHSVAEGVDLDWIFRPPSVGSHISGGARFQIGALEPEGSGWITIFGTNMRDGGLGFCPWSTMVHNKLEIAPYGRQVQDTGRFLGTTRGSSTMLRGLLSGSAPIIFSVDADRMADEWAQYQFDLRTFILKQDISDEAKRKIIDWLASDGPSFGWAPFSPDDFDASKGYDNFGIPQSEPVRFWRMVSERQRQLLRSPVIAYLDRDFPALAGSPSNLRTWENNRDKLLEHPARCNVDLRNVPDPIYLAALEASRAGPACIAVGGITTRPDDTMGGGVLPPLPPPKPPRGSVGGDGAGGAAAAIALLLGVAGGTYWYTQRR